MPLQHCHLLFGKPHTSQEKFIVEMEKIVTQKRTVRLVKDAGWYSESEMKNDLEWSQQLDSKKSLLEKDICYIHMTCRNHLLST